MNYKKYSIRWLIAKNEITYKRLGWKSASSIQLGYDISEIDDVHLYFEPNESMYKHKDKILDREKERINMLIKQVFKDSVLSIKHFTDDNDVRTVDVQLNIDCKFFV